MATHYTDKPLTERIAEVQATIALIERREKLDRWARSLSIHMQDLPPYSYERHDLYKARRDEFDAQGMEILRELRAGNYYVRSMTPNDNLYNLLDTVRELSE